jgi:phage tail P2-like protein
MITQDLLPISATKQERDISIAIDRGLTYAFDLKSLWNVDECDESLLPWLAWAFAVDTWENSWTLAVKRSVIKNALYNAKRKGTAKTAKDALAAIGAQSTIVEWFEETPIGAPYTFKIYVVAADSSPMMQAAIDRAIRSTMPVRCWPSIIFGVTATSGINISPIGRPCVYARLDFAANY